MSISQILGSTPANLTPYQHGTVADPLAILVANPGGLVIDETQGVGSAAGLTVQTTAAGADCSLYLKATTAAGANNSYRWTVGGTTSGGLVAGNLQLFAYPAVGGIQNSISVGADGVVQFPDATQCGVATVLAGSAVIAVPNTAITANSVILLTPQLNDATAVRVAAVLNPGVGFTITAPANATANLPVAWFIARY